MVFLFDIGRVLLDFNFESSLARLIPANIKNPQERISLLLNRKDQLEAGLISQQDYTQWALNVLGSNATAAQFHHAWQQIFTINEPMWCCVKKLAADGHRLILFSNISEIHYPWIIEAYPDFLCFDGAVISFETGFIKPQPEIYQHAVSTYQLNPSKTFYIDDQAQNIFAGKQIGFHCWQYTITKHHDFEQWLKIILQKFNQ